MKRESFQSVSGRAPRIMPQCSWLGLSSGMLLGGTKGTKALGPVRNWPQKSSSVSSSLRAWKYTCKNHSRARTCLKKWAVLSIHPTVSYPAVCKIIWIPSLLVRKVETPLQYDSFHGFFHLKMRGNPPWKRQFLSSGRNSGNCLPWDISLAGRQDKSHQQLWS